MEIEDVIKNRQRNYKEEKEILLKFSQILKSEFSLKEIKRTLEDNGFNGLYILEDDIYSEIYDTQDALGIYKGKEKVIILNKKYCKDGTIGIHEMGHAFLDGRNISEIMYNEQFFKYGKGLEEGAVTLVMSNHDILDISNYNRRIYPYQSKLFLQLDVLYNSSKLKEYPNLLVHMFKNPEGFIKLIKDVYEDIYKSSYSGFTSHMAMRSAFAMIAGTDALTDINAYDNILIGALNTLNSLYLYVSDEKVREGFRKPLLFTSELKFDITGEEKLLGALFGSQDGYMIRMLENLEVLLNLIQSRLEDIRESEIDSKCKIILPR